MNENDHENDKTGSARSLWCRLISGVELTSDEQAVLRDALGSDETLREECDADATLHALLLSMNDVKQSEDDFVRGVMRAVDKGTSETKKSEVEVGKREPLARAGGGLRRKSAPGWLALTVTAMLFASVGLMAWWFSDQRQAGSGDLQVQAPITPEKKDPAGNADKTSVAQIDAEPAKEVSPRVKPDSGIRNVRTTDVVASQQGPSVDPSEQMGETRAAQVEKKTGALPGSTFVTLTKIEDPVWERSWVEGDRIGDDVVRLFGGRLELSFDDGAKVTLEGPIEFRPMTSGQLQLRRGRLMAAVPKEAIGFTVSTPTSQVVDLGTEFEVSVKETGASDVVVNKGEIEVMPAVADGEAPRKWRLVPNGLNQASFFERTGEVETSPVSAAIRGTDGAFQGMISINGQAAEFTSAEAFDDVRERVMQQFEKSQQETLQQWTEFVASMNQNVQGTMQLNGAEVQFGNFEDVMKLQQQMLDRMQIPGGDPVNFPESNFSGSFNVNGKVITFKTREEYEAARRTAFGAAANFGAGDVLRPRTRLKQK